MVQRFIKNSARRVAQRFLGYPHPETTMLNWYQYYFFRYKEARRVQRPWKPDSLCPPFERGLISIVLPVYNGEKHLEEAIKSILAQTHENFELIIIDDGSTDSSPAIMDKYAAIDSRIKVVHQENQKLPRSLSRGFRMARGEFLTWTSDDNRLKPNFLEKMAECLRRHPHWDMVYANMDIIGEDGKPLRNSDWYSNYQVPPGSEHIHLPENTLELNIWPNQYIGAAFMYRARVASLLRDYSPYRFTIEDYDYFMQINEFFDIHHADFKETVYEYRFHGSSLTSKEKELQILKQREFLMVFDDFRRDFNLTPMLWLLDDGATGDKDIAKELKQMAKKSADLLEHPEKWPSSLLPNLWFPCCYVRVSEKASDATKDISRNLPSNSIKVLVYTGKETLPSDVHTCWDLLLYTKGQPPVRTGTPFQGWHHAKETKDIFAASEILCRKRQFERIEKEIFEPSPVHLKYSVVICTYKRTHILKKALEAALNQSFPPEDYEIIVVNNDPDCDLSPLISRLKGADIRKDRPAVRLVLCPFKGLSHARNAGISKARGEVVCFLDDDALAQPDWLSEIHRAYQDEPEAGLVGGKIVVRAPNESPEWLEEQALVYWSHFDPPVDDITWTENWWEFPWGANWTAKKKALLEIGGFRCRYGRKGNDFGGGEELIAGCLIHRLGYKVGINPKAKVLHVIDPSRFTKEHVMNTIRSALLVNYRLQTDLYMPRWMNGSEAAKKTGSWIKDLARYHVLSPFERLRVKSNIKAHMALMKLIAHDYKMRAKGNRK